MVHAPCQVGHAAHRLAAPYIYAAPPCARLPRSGGHFSYHISSDYNEQGSTVSPEQCQRSLAGRIRFQSGPRQPVGLRAGGRRRYRRTDKQLEINVRARYYFGLSDVLRNRNKYADNGIGRLRKPILRRLCDPRWTTSLFSGVQLPLQQGGLHDLETASQTRKEQREVFKYKGV